MSKNNQKRVQTLNAEAIKTNQEKVAEESVDVQVPDGEEIAELTKKVLTLRAEAEKLREDIGSLKLEKEMLSSEIKDERASAKKELAELKTKMEEECAEKMAETKSQVKALETKCKDDCARETAALKEIKAQINAKESELADKEKQLYKRENEVAAREQSASAGFAKQFEDEMNRAKTRIDELNRQIEELKIKKEQVITQTENDALRIRAERTAETDKLLQSKRDALDEAVKKVRGQEEKLNQRQFAQDEKEEELASELRMLELRKNGLDNRRQAFEAEVQKAVSEQYAQLSLELQDKRDLLNKVLEEKQSISRERDELKLKLRDARSTSAEKRINELEEELFYAQQQSEEYKAKLISDEISKKDIEAYKVKAAEYDKLAKTHEKVCKELATLRAELLKMHNDSESLKVVSDYNGQLKATVEELTEQLNRKKTITRLERLDAVTRPLPALEKLDKLNNFTLTEENKWLEYIKNQAEMSGIVFSKRLLDAYHTSIKIGDWSPLVVLAGVSGTGKSELPRQYALHGGMNFLSVPVKPDWDSPQSLFGYYNSIENKFEATELLRALYQMQSGDKMLMVLLDEMNLAHVELYFSDLLSKFETRRGTNGDVEYEISLGAGADGEILKIGNNILWTGTMNEDETTKTLSDKVVDRSTLITFPRPKKLIGRKNVVNMDAKYSLKRSQWRKWVDGALPLDKIDDSLMNEMRETVEQINALMSKLGRTLGHRVWQSIQNYIVNHPTVIAYKNDEGKKKEYVQKAFAEAVAFKIMPKLRGVETTGASGDIVNDIAKLIQERVPDLTADFNNAKGLPSDIFMWHTAEFLEK